MVASSHELVIVQHVVPLGLLLLPCLQQHVSGPEGPAPARDLHPVVARLVVQGSLPPPLLLPWAGLSGTVSWSSRQFHLEAGMYTCHDER